MSDLTVHEGLFAVVDGDALLEMTRQGYKFVREIVGPRRVQFLLTKTGENAVLDDAVKRYAELEANYQQVADECSTLREQMGRLQRDVDRELERRNKSDENSKRFVAVFNEMRSTMTAEKFDEIVSRVNGQEKP